MSIIKRYSIGEITVAIAPIDPAPRLSRREREREAVKSILDELAAEQNANLELGHDANGAPIIAGHCVSISHCERYAAVAISPDANLHLGIDIEKPRPTLRRVAPRFLSAAERQRLSTLDELLTAWTVKEAVYKAALTRSLPLTEIETSADMAYATAHGESYGLNSWQFDDCTVTLAIKDTQAPTNGHKSAIAALHALIAMVCLLAAACSPTKHVPTGEMLLDNVRIRVDNDSIRPQELVNFLRQTPNHKVLGFAKLQLGVYSLSGRDSTKWYNKWLRKIGQAPSIYDQGLTNASQMQLRQAMINRGYMDARVEVDTTIHDHNRRIDVTYNILPGAPYRIANLKYHIPDSAIASIVFADTTAYHLEQGAMFDRNKLDEFRSGITSRLRNSGYFAFNKDDINFTADTTAGSKMIDLTLNVLPPGNTVGTHRAELSRHLRYMVKDVYFITDFNSLDALGDHPISRQDTVKYKGISVLYGKDRYIAPEILEEKCHIVAGKPYVAADVDRTYQSLSQLGILKYINIEMKPADKIDGYEALDAYVLLSPNKKQGVTFEVDGTNSEGDLGFGVSATYMHRNLAKRSNLLTVKARTAYESLSGNVEGLINNRYTEYAGEVGITFPKLEAPFISSAYKKRLQASTEFSISGNYQERPEYTRIILGGAWKYKWTIRKGGYNIRNNIDLIDINYVRLPKSTINFLDSIAPTNPLLRYSYEDHFIMRIGYSFYRSNKRIPTIALNAFAIQPYVHTARGAVEAAGNLLYLGSRLTGQHKSDDAYKVFGIQYAQYVKAEADYTYVINLNPRNALAFHAGAGVAVPYLNSSMVPFEKRFYAGGANSVRGWSVRSLGPGRYDSRNSMTDFINQCGDILLNLNIEYRAKLFWVLESALFIDAGNIWTIRNYETQPGGVFKIGSFYKEIAAAYGVGLRLDFNYFLLRFDLGFKAHNPAINQEPWPIFHPNWKRDANFHFAVGYPF